MDIMTYYSLNFFFFTKKDRKRSEKRKVSFKTKEEGLESMEVLKKNPYARIQSFYQIVETRKSINCNAQAVVI